MTGSWSTFSQVSESVQGNYATAGNSLALHSTYLVVPTFPPLYVGVKTKTLKLSVASIFKSPQQITIAPTVAGGSVGTVTVSPATCLFNAGNSECTFNVLPVTAGPVTIQWIQQSPTQIDLLPTPHTLVNIMPRQPIAGAFGNWTSAVNTTKYVMTSGPAAPTAQFTFCVWALASNGSFSGSGRPRGLYVPRNVFGLLWPDN